VYPHATNHTHHVGCGHVAYYCDRCHFHTTALSIFYDHVYLSHRVSVATVPTVLTWSPVNLTFIFD
jgi:hypothetical protein